MDIFRSTSLPQLDTKQTSSSDSDTKAQASDIPQSSELGRYKKQFDKAIIKSQNFHTFSNIWNVILHWVEKNSENY